MSEVELLRKEVEDLKLLHQLDMVEIVRLRRWIQALEEEQK